MAAKAGVTQLASECGSILTWAFYGLWGFRGQRIRGTNWSVRFAIVRAWTAAAAALLAAVAADAGTEFAGNSGWLGAGLIDNQHEAVLPTLAIGLTVALCLLAFVLLARIAPRDPLLLRMSDLRVRFAEIACAFCGSVLCIVAMEGAETHFGGISPFDPRSVVVSHLPALLVASLVVGVIVYYALHVAIGIAARASVAVAGFFVAVFPRRRELRAASRTTRISAFEFAVSRVPLGIADGSRGLRAPPRSLRLSYFIA